MYAKAIWKLYRVKALCCNEKENLRDWVFFGDSRERERKTLKREKRNCF